jgi:hypothetical protein
VGRLQGKAAVITGGTTEIGFAAAKLFVKEGAYVFITGRRQKELDEAVEAIRDNVTGVRATSPSWLTLIGSTKLSRRTGGKSTSSSPTPASGSSPPWAALPRSIPTGCSTSMSRERCSRSRKLFRY